MKKTLGMLAMVLLAVSIAGAALASQPDGMITLADARRIALEAAGLSEAGVMMTKLAEDNDHRRREYEVEFVTGGTEYEYVIDAADGAIVETKTKTLRDREVSRLGGQYISMDDAVAKARAQAGATADQAILLEAKFDFEDGYAVYEVELLIDGRVQAFDIDAETADVIAYNNRRGKGRDRDE